MENWLRVATPDNQTLAAPDYKTTSQRDNQWGGSRNYGFTESRNYGFMESRIYGQGEAASLLITHCSKYYNITKGARVVGITESRDYGKLASLCYARQQDNESTRQLVGRQPLAVSWSCRLVVCEAQPTFVFCPLPFVFRRQSAKRQQSLTKKKTTCQRRQIVFIKQL